MLRAASRCYGCRAALQALAAAALLMVVVKVDERAATALMLQPARFRHAAPPYAVATCCYALLQHCRGLLT